MHQPPLTGSRIRQRRLDQGLRQTHLAQKVGISPAYLNLIEHNRRRIGGKLLVDLARALGVEPASLAESADVAMLGTMRAAAARVPELPVEVARAEELAGRFPGWSDLVAVQHRRIRELEHLVAGLSDRLTHDPHLAASLHDLLSSVTAIRSAASILTEPGALDPEWQARFLRNVGEDSARLAESAEALVRYLEAADEPDTGHIAPQEELGAFLSASSYHFAELEAEGEGDIDALLDHAPMLQTAASMALARRYLTRYRADARRLPEAGFHRLWEACSGDPGVVAAQTDTDPAMVLRRAAALLPGSGQAETGLATCDGSGALLVRKPLRGFAMPRFGSACPLWPLYQALARPGHPIRMRVEMPGTEPERFLCLAIALPSYPAGFAGPPVYEATMLILPDSQSDQPPLPIGTNCRICPRQTCPARHEPSILSGPV